MPRTKLPPVIHLSGDERSARGKESRASAPRTSHAQLNLDARDAVALLDEQSVPRYRARADPLRAHARLAVHVLPRRGGDHGRRPRARTPRTGLTCSSAATPTSRTSAASRRRSGARLRPQRLRRDAARPVRVGREAARGELRDRRPRPRLRRRRATRSIVLAARRARTARRCARSRRCATSTSGTRGIDADARSSASCARRSSEDAKALTRGVAKARTKDSMQAFAKLDPRRRRRAADHLRPAADRPARRARGRGDAPSVEAEDRADASTYRRSLPSDRRDMLERYRLVDMARKVVGVGSVGTRAWIVLLLGRDDGDPLFLQVKEAAGVGARAATSARAQFANQAARRRGPAPDAGGERHLPRLGPRRPRRRARDFYLRQLWDWKVGRRRGDLAGGSSSTGTLRLDARAGARALGRPDRDRLLPRQGRRLRPGRRRFAEAYADQTSATTTPWSRRQTTVGSKSRGASNAVRCPGRRTRRCGLFGPRSAAARRLERRRAPCPIAQPGRARASSRSVLRRWAKDASTTRLDPLEALRQRYAPERDEGRSTFGGGRKTVRATGWKPVRSAASWTSTETAP